MEHVVPKGFPVCGNIILNHDICMLQSHQLKTLKSFELVRIYIAMALI